MQFHFRKNSILRKINSELYEALLMIVSNTTGQHDGRQ